MAVYIDGYAGVTMKKIFYSLVYNFYWQDK